MANFRIKIDLLKLRGASVQNVQGKTATKRCLIVPVDECDGVFLGEKGCYLSMAAIEMREPKYNDTHCVKPDIPKEQRETMTDGERNAVPILGGMHAIERQQPQTMQVTSVLDTNAFVDNGLPF